MGLGGLDKYQNHGRMVHPPKVVANPSTNRAQRCLTSFTWRTPS